jgi:hypothetical protein
MTDDGPQGSLRDLLARALPRLLTQLCRDPDHPLYGCFDRHHWHYKMRDFSSAVLVQGSLVLDVLARGELRLEVPALDAGLAARWRDAALRHWAAIQRPDGSHDEYYAYESGFPAAGFSLYAASVIARHTRPGPDVARAMQRGAAWILRRPEIEAMNQEIVALTGCTLAARAGIPVDASALAERWRRVFAAQSPEGWYEEYGGADAGYLSVALDALWDCWEATGDERARVAAARAAEWMHALQGVSGTVPAAVNSRNTDYLVGYGLARWGAELPAASGVLRRSLVPIGSPRHFLHRVDDRYLGHYVHSSWFRALPYLDRLGPAASPAQGARWFPQCRVLVSHGQDASVYVAAGKGGVVVREDAEGRVELDAGWRGETRGRLTTTCWQEPAARVDARPEADAWIVRTEMPLRAHGFLRPTPLQHLALRIVGALAGQRLVPALKARLIFRNRDTGARFVREVRVEGTSASVRDAFSGAPLENPRREGHYSLRHVSSAGGFSFSEMAPAPTTSWITRSPGPDAAAESAGVVLPGPNPRW